MSEKSVLLDTYTNGFAKVSASLDSLGHLCGISMHDIYLYPEAAIEALSSGIPKLKTIVGDRIDVFVPYTTPVIKYGHLNALGLELSFPIDGQVAPKHSELSPEDLLTMLRVDRSMSWEKLGMTPDRLFYLEALRRAFPGERVHWGWQWEGPVTTAWALLGENLFLLLYDDPDLLKEILILCSKSLNSFIDYYCVIDGTKIADPFPDYGRLCDDIAAMLAPAFWESHIHPCWEQFYKGKLPMKKLHCEGLKITQLDFLNQLHITDFDSGISPALNPGILNEELVIPYTWRLGSFHYQEMTLHDIAQFVYASANAGCSYVFTFFEPMMLNEETMGKVQRFYDTGLMVNRMLKDNEKNLKDLIDPDWDWSHWNGYVE